MVNSGAVDVGQIHCVCPDTVPVALDIIIVAVSVVPIALAVVGGNDDVGGIIVMVVDAGGMVDDVGIDVGGVIVV